MVERNKKKILIGVLCVALIVMSIGYATFSSVLDIRGVGKIKKAWNVYIESIETSRTEGNGSGIAKTSDDKLSASFISDFYEVGDSVTYKVHVKNEGSITAKLSNATIINEEANEQISFEILNKDTEVIDKVLKPKETIDIYVKSKYVGPDDGGSETIVAESTIQLTFIQPDATSGSTPAENGGSTETVTTLASGDISETSSDHVTWTYNSNGVLTISGTGTMIEEFGYSFRNNEDNLNNVGLSVGYIKNQIAVKILQAGDISNDKLFNLNGSVVDPKLLPQVLATALYDEEYLRQFTQNELGIEFVSWDSTLDSLVTAEMISSEDKAILLQYVPNIPKITSVVIENGVTNIGYDMLYESGYKGSIVIPSSVTNIGDRAFYSNLITSVTIPSSVTNIGEDAFAKNNITSLNIKTSSVLSTNHSFSCNPNITLTSDSVITDIANLGGITCVSNGSGS